MRDITTQTKHGFYHWLKNLLRTEHDTGRTCPACGGRIVSTLNWVGEIEYCEDCKRIDSP